MRRFEFRDGKSAKFWTIALAGRSFTVTYGKIGSAGQTQTKDFKDEAKAKKEHDKLVAEKLAKGYVETTAGAPAPVAGRQVGPGNPDTELVLEIWTPSLSHPSDRP
jgi:predicted DNA-binding WGR domain protein